MMAETTTNVEENQQEKQVGSTELKVESEADTTQTSLGTDDQFGNEVDEMEKGNRPSGILSRFPRAFYDPVTKIIMLDPVVHQDGESYEKDEESEAKGYPNRALKSYIEQELDRYSEAGSARAAMQDLGDSLRSGWNKLVEGSVLPAGEGRALPESFYCPISFELIHQPVIDPEGHTYEKLAIEHWIKANEDSPVTRTPLTVDQLYENKAVLSVLTELSEQDAESMHPSIQKWKEDHNNQQYLASIIPPEVETQQQQHMFPTTQAELDERRRQRRQNNCTTFAILLACLIVFLFFPSYFFLFTIIIACAWFLHEPYRQRQQQVRRQVIRNQAIQEIQLHEQQRIERMQQQQQQANGV